MSCSSLKLYSTVTVGTKGQIVIPKDVRKALNINPGDKLVTITKGDIAIGFIKSESMKFVLNHLNQEMQGDCYE